MVQRRALSLAQRSAKNERDRQRGESITGLSIGLRVNFAIDHLKNIARAYYGLKAWSDRGNYQKDLESIEQRMSELKIELCSLQERYAKKLDEWNSEETEEAERKHCISQWQFKIQAMLKETMDHGSVSSPHDMQYTDKFVQDFIEKLDDKEKSRVDFPDFKGLTEELEKSGRFNLPPSLVPIDEILKKAYGDITAESNQSTPVIRVSYILFCSVIKEMNESQLEQVDLDKLILWRNAINSGLSIGFKGKFAIEHLKKIAHAYFGSKGQHNQELKSMEERMSKLKTELYALEKKHNCIAEEQSSEVRRECIVDQQYFRGKPLSAGLFFC
ncbi:hypothetical protein REPUB_Repub07fG0176400 [Reevesia pubescens]